MTTDHLIAWLKSGPRLGDGAMGTMLQEAGLPLGACPEAWNVQRPEAVRAVHAAYREAGAEWLQTNSFGGNRFRLRRAGLDGRLEEINLAAVRLAREVAGHERSGGGLLVVGTIGPTGERLCREQGITADEAAAVFVEQAEILAAAGVDLILIETMTALDEASVALEAIGAQVALPVIVTLVFEPDGRTLGGDEPEAVAARLVSAGAAALGGNCGAGPAALLPAIERLRAAAPEVPLIAQPSAGLPRWIGGQPVYDLSPAEMALWGRRLVDAGADLIGGCCGTTPAHLRVFAAALQ